MSNEKATEAAQEVDDFGFFKGVQGSPASVPFCKKEDTVVCSKWDDLLKKWDEEEAVGLLIAHNGIPHSCRSSAWPALCASSAKRVEGLYEKLLRTPNNSEIIAQINLDLTRSFPTHSFISSPQGQQQLYNVLYAFSQYNQTVGYCQGMAFLAAVLLMVLPTAEDAFWTFVAMIIGKRIDTFYSPGMKGIVHECALFEHVLKFHDEKLAKHIQEKNGILPLLYLVPWIVPLWTNLNNWNAVLSAWDFFFAKGITALRSCALALVTLNSSRIFEKKDANELIPFLINPPVKTLHDENWIATALSLPIAKLYERAEAALIDEKNHPQKVLSTPQKSHKRSRENDSSDESIAEKRHMKTPQTDGDSKRRVVRRKEEESLGFVARLKKTLTPNSSSSSSPLPTATTTKQQPRTIAAIRRSKLTSENSTTTTTPISTTSNAISPCNNDNNNTPKISPQSRNAFKEFSTPSPAATGVVVYHGKQWRMNPTSPLSPVMMELTPLLQHETFTENDQNDLDRAEIAAKAPDARYYD